MLSIGFMTFLGLLGAGLLLAAILLDGVFDFLGSEPVLPAVAFFTSIFGFTGALTASIMDAPPMAVFLGISGGVALLSTFLFFLVYRGLKRATEEEENFTPDFDQLIGKPCTVDWWREGRGEVLVSWFGATRRVPATSQDDLTNVHTAYVASVISLNSIVVSATQPNS